MTAASIYVDFAKEAWQEKVPKREMELIHYFLRVKACLGSLGSFSA